TLLRSFRKTITTTGERDGLEKGRTRFRFALLPFAGTLPRGRALAELARLQGGVMTRQTGKLSSGYPAMNGSAGSRGFVDCGESPLVVSAIKAPETGPGLILRLWNPMPTAATGEIRFWKEVASAQRLLLNEEPDPEAPAPGIREGALRVE